LIRARLAGFEVTGDTAITAAYKQEIQKSFDAVQALENALAAIK
jgi:hypothetical protein